MSRFDAIFVPERAIIRTPSRHHWNTDDPFADPLGSWFAHWDIAFPPFVVEDRIMTSLEQLDSDVQDQLRRYWGVRDLGSLTEPPDGTDFEGILSHFGEQLEALGQEVQAVKTRIEHLLSAVAQYIGDESEV